MAKPVAMSIFEILDNDTMSQSSSVREVFEADKATNKQVAIGIAVEDRFARAVSLKSLQKIHFLLGRSAKWTYSTMKGPKAGIEIFLRKSFPDMRNFSCALTNQPMAPNPVYDRDSTHAAFQKPETDSLGEEVNPSMNRIASCLASVIYPLKAEKLKSVNR